MMEHRRIPIAHEHPEPVVVYTQQQKEFLVGLAMICFTLLYLAMRLAGVTLAVWW